MSGARHPSFERYIGIDYSGAKTPTSGLPGLRIYMADRATDPDEVRPLPSRRKHWTRRGVAEWLRGELAAGAPALIGIDHGFSFPLAYFERHGLPRDWDAFLEDFHRHWPTDADDLSVDSIRQGRAGNGAGRAGVPSWRRLTEIRAGTAKSVFRFDVQGSVAKSTHAGLPWLRYLRRSFERPTHCWPFDGWEIPPGASALVEVYPALWSRAFPKDGRTGDQHDAYSIAAWMRAADHAGTLESFLRPTLKPADALAARIEGWILGLR